MTDVHTGLGEWPGATWCPDEIRRTEDRKCIENGRT